MLRALVSLGCAACGRFAFDDAPSRDRGNVDDAPTIDARTDPACPLAASAPDTITLAGQTFRYTSFDNMHTALSATTVTVFDAITGAQLNTMVSNSTGDYSIPIATGGVPRKLRVGYERASWFTSTVHFDQHSDSSITGPNAMLWQLGDAPLWDAVGMDSVYDTVGKPRKDTHGTINVAIRTCAGAAIPDVDVTVSPIPDAIAYTTTTGIVSMTGTQDPYTHAVVFNALPGPNVITADAPGLVFPELTVDVQAGAHNTLVIMRPYE